MTRFIQFKKRLVNLKGNILKEAWKEIGPGIERVAIAGEAPRSCPRAAR